MLALLYRVPIYLAPFVMAGMEGQLNEVAKRPEAYSLLGPSVGAAAVGLLLPLLRPSTSALVGWKLRVDRGLSPIGVASLFVFLYVWQMLVAANLGGSMHWWVPHWNFWNLGRGAS